MSAASILVVDDEAAMGRLFRRILRQDGHQVQAVTTGAEALAQVAQQQPALVILDLHLPDMDGWSLLTALRAAGVVVVVVSGCVAPQTARRAEELGASAVLSKPFDPDRLRAVLMTALSGRAPEEGVPTCGS